MSKLEIVRVPVFLEPVDVTREFAWSELFPELDGHQQNRIFISQSLMLENETCE